jgi:hypothetical protein
MSVPAMSNIKSILDEAMKHVVFDAKLAKQIHDFGQRFVNKNPEHSQFFGGNLTGVQKVAFLPSDRETLLEDILGIDETRIRPQITRLPGIKATWKRATDVYNLACLYVAHRFYHSDLPTDVKEKAMEDVLLVLQYKLLTSLLRHYMPFQVDEPSAMAVYAVLSKKFAIKKHGSWMGLLVARAQDVYSDSSIHLQTLNRFDDIGAVVYMISDIQIRLRAIVKRLTNVLKFIKQQKTKILSDSAQVSLDDKTVVKDLSRLYPPYRRYLSEIVIDQRRFIKPELITVIGNMVTTMPEKLLYDALVYVHHAAVKRDPVVDGLLNETLLHAFDALAEQFKGRGPLQDISGMLSRLKALYMASRSSDPVLLNMRDVGENIIKLGVKSKNPSVIASVRTGLFLYVILRTLTKDHYG